MYITVVVSRFRCIDQNSALVQSRARTIQRYRKMRSLVFQKFMKKKSEMSEIFTDYFIEETLKRDTNFVAACVRKVILGPSLTCLAGIVMPRMGLYGFLQPIWRGGIHEWLYPGLPAKRS